MISELLAILDALKYPVFLQGSLNPDDGFPDSFFTYWNHETQELSFYSNLPHSAVWQFWVYFYSTDRQTVETVTDQAFNAFRDAGWTLASRPHDVGSGVPTHTGRMFSVRMFKHY